jgi:hypothetical protein
MDWKAEAIRRFGPVPEGGGENARLVAGYHYAFIEGAKAALLEVAQAKTEKRDAKA